MVNFKAKRKEIVEVVRDPYDELCTLTSLMSCGDGLFSNVFLSSPKHWKGNILDTPHSLNVNEDGYIDFLSIPLNRDDVSHLKDKLCHSFGGTYPLYLLSETV